VSAELVFLNPLKQLWLHKFVRLLTRVIRSYRAHFLTNKNQRTYVDSAYEGGRIYIILTYRIIFGLVDVCMSDYFQPMATVYCNQWYPIQVIG